jgi:multicomponent Na+:H+ antiporter subunit D
VALAGVAMFVCGLFIKGGQMPFHGWLPDVYADSPSAVSVFLAGAVTKLLGAFVLLRFALSVVKFSPAVNGVILFVGVLSIVAGAFLALGQADLKRMFAYSSISQIGYILAGLGSGGTLGMAGAVLHLFNHSVFKSTLFLNAAALESRASTRDINKLGGLSQKMPATAFTSVIASLSCAGIPPLAGFWSKLLIIMGLWAAGFRAYAVIAVVTSVVTLAYLLSVQRQVFWGRLNEEFAAVKETGWELMFPALLLTLVTVGVGMAFPLMLKMVGL